MLNEFRRMMMALLNYWYEKLPNKIRRYIIRVFHFIFYKKRLRLEFHLTEHCNLNCAGCNHFSSIAEPGFTDPAKLKKDLVQMRKIFGKKGISQIEMLGGEPLLHPQINKILYMVRHIFPDTSLHLLTNGTLLPKMDENFFTSCRENGVHIMVTNYPIGFDYDTVIEKIRNGGVICELFNYESDKTMFKQPLDMKGEQNPKDMFDLCVMANNCVTLKDGRLYTCMTIPNIVHFNKYFGKTLEVTEADYIDIYLCTDRKQIRKKLNTYSHFCRYCKVKDKVFGIKWRGTEKKIHEWT